MKLEINKKGLRILHLDKNDSFMCKKCYHGQEIITDWFYCEKSKNIFCRACILKKNVCSLDRIGHIDFRIDTIENKKRL